MKKTLYIFALCVFVWYSSDKNFFDNVNLKLMDNHMPSPELKESFS